MSNVLHRHKYAYLFAFCYGLSFLLGHFFSLWVFFYCMGALLLFIIPGYFLLPFTGLSFYIEQPFSWFFIPPLSLTVFGVAELFFSRFFRTYSSATQLALLVFVVAIVYIASRWGKAEKTRDKMAPDYKEELKQPVSLYVAMLFPLAFLCLCWYVYPYFVGDDTYLLVDPLRTSIVSQHLVQQFLDRRPLFTPVLLLAHYATGISAVALLQFLLPFLVIVSFLSPFVLVSRLTKTKQWYYFVFPLIFFASPYVFFQIQYAIPQSFILIFTLPVLILTLYGLKYDDLRLIVSALIMGFVSVGFHELGLILLLTAGMAWIVYTLRRYKQNRRLMVQRALVSGVVLLPYAILFQIADRFVAIILIVKASLSKTHGVVQLRWWYVNYYQNPDGIVFSYPGWKGLLWYAYLGALIVLCLLAASGLWFYLNRKNKPLGAMKLGKELADHSPLIFFTLFFYFVAEMYPRIFKIAFLPERAWLFFSIGCGLLFVVVCTQIGISYPRHRSILIALSVVTVMSVIMGCLGAVYLTYNRGILLSKDETNAILFLKQKAPPDATIVSTQSYDSGIAIFANRKFLPIPVIKSTDFSGFQNDVLVNFSKKNVSMPAVSVVTVYGLDGALLSQKKTVLIDEKEVKSLQDNTAWAPIYFVYSLKRFEKLQFVSSVNYLNQNDFVSKDFYFRPDIKYHAVYSDSNVVIFQIR